MLCAVQLKELGQEFEQSASPRFSSNSQTTGPEVTLDLTGQLFGAANAENALFFQPVTASIDNFDGIFNIFYDLLPHSDLISVSFTPAEFENNFKPFFVKINR